MSRIETLDDRTDGASEAVAMSRADVPTVRVFGPASLSNLGPGFDALGLCIEGIGDVVEMRRIDQPGIVIESISGDGGLLPRDPRQNTASVAARLVLELAGADGGFSMRIEKRVPFGSGIGGSAASAVAGAWAANVALGRPFEKDELVHAVLSGEEMASGSKHGDNVLPALFGGLVLVSSSEPERYRRIDVARPLPVAVLAPEVQILTKTAREILPERVSLRDAAHNASELGFLVDAFRSGDWASVGRCIMQDRLVEAVRASLLPCYDAVRSAAMEAGALGCALTGSGPAMFALAETPEGAESALTAMIAACHASDISASGFVTRADARGVREIS